jgi:hypothetical protein
MKGQMELLIASLNVLASAPSIQLEHLAQLGLPEGIDELALEYDDIAAAAGTMLNNGVLNQAQADCATKLNQFQNEFSGQANAHLWTVEALQSAEEWKTVRGMAAECLATLK